MARFPEMRLCDTCRGSGSEMIKTVGGAISPSGDPCPDCLGTGEARTEKESLEENKILSEVTEITVRVVRNGVVKSGTRVIPNSLIEPLIPSLLAMELEALSRDVAEAAGLPVSDQKPKGLAALAVAAEDALKKLAQVVGPHLSDMEMTWLRCALHDVADLKALPLDEFLREDGQ